MQAIKRTITVDANHEIHLAAPELPAGSQVEVIVLLTGSSDITEKEDLVSLLGKHPRFLSSDEVVDYVRQLREDRA
ncbi:hypothetical protein MTYM_01314 [Methylococcales bacterium]|nr:hypothetical protein MTYM_01314 [Methylococcales bacterium]